MEMNSWAYLRLVARHFSVDRREHATAFAAGSTQINANIRLQTHSVALQRCINGQMDWIVTFARIIFVDDRTVVGYFMASSPPA